MQPRLTALVLAGGAARRLGGSKWERDVGGRSLLQRSLDVAARAADETLLLPGDRCLPDDIAPGVRRVADWPGVDGPLAGLGAGLQAARHDWCLLLACDMPFADAALALRLAARAGRDEGDVVVLRSRAGLEPFFALYHRRVLDAVHRQIAAGDRSLHGLLAGVPRLELPAAEFAGEPDPLLLCNVNTPADLERARAACAGARS